MIYINTFTVLDDVCCFRRIYGNDKQKTMLSVRLKRRKQEMQVAHLFLPLNWSWGNGNISYNQQITYRLYK